MFVKNVQENARVFFTMIFVRDAHVDVHSMIDYTFSFGEPSMRKHSYDNLHVLQFFVSCVSKIFFLFHPSPIDYEN